MLEDRDRRLRARQRNVACVGAQRGQRAQARRAGHARRAAHDDDVARGVLVVLGGAARDGAQDLPRRARVPRLDGLEPDVGHHDLTRVEPPRRHLVTHLERMEGHAEVGANRHARHLTGRGVDPGGDVDGGNPCAGVVDRLDQPRGLRPRLAVKARSEQRVENDLGAPGLVRHLRVLPGSAQDLGRDPAVSSVLAAAADSHEALRVRPPPHRLLGDGTAGPFHELFFGARIALLRGAHLVSGVQGLKHPARRGKRQPPAHANASSRGRSAPRRLSRPTSACGQSARPRALAARGSRSRAR